MYGPYIERPVPLTYDTTIYWHEGAWHHEQMISRVMAKYERESGWAYARANEELDYACQKKARELGWRAYHEEETEEKDDAIIRLRRTMYECPGFHAIKLWRVPHAVYTLRLKPEDGPIVDLPLRQLHFRGEHARGVLHENTLHVCLFAPR